MRTVRALFGKHASAHADLTVAEKGNDRAPEANRRASAHQHRSSGSPCRSQTNRKCPVARQRPKGTTPWPAPPPPPFFPSRDRYKHKTTGDIDGGSHSGESHRKYQQHDAHHQLGLRGAYLAEGDCIGCDNGDNEHGTSCRSNKKSSSHVPIVRRRSPITTDLDRSSSLVTLSAGLAQRAFLSTIQPCRHDAPPSSCFNKAT